MTHRPLTRVPALLFGIPIDDVTMSETIEAVGELVDDGRRSGRTHQIATVNVDFLVNAIADPEVQQLLQRADVCIPDGMPVIWGARAAGMPLRERVAGADLVPALAAASVRAGWKIHLFGSAEGIAEQAATLLTERYPGAQVSGVSGPFMRDITAVDPDVLDAIAAIDADILCVALGNPKQERFINLYGPRLGVPVMIGVGGTLDFLVGGRKRAPQWVQKVGLEWVVRAAQEPARLGKRYARDGYVFFPHLARYLRTVRRMRGGGSFAVDTSTKEVIVAATTNATGSWESALDAAASGRPVTLDLSRSPSVTAVAMASLIGLIRAARRIGAVPTGDAVSGALASDFDRLGVREYLDDRDGRG